MASIGATGGDDFLSHVMRVRSEIQDKFLRAHRVLQEREADLLAKLRELEDEFIEDVITQRINHLSMTKDGLITALKGNENKDLLEKSTAPIDASILELERKLRNVKDTYKSVTLDWDVELEDKLSLTGDILLNGVTERQVRDYKKIEMPVVTFGKHSKYVSTSPGVFCFPTGVFCFPTGLAIDPETNYLYICDDANNHIQVFNDSFEFIFQFSDKVNRPSDICIKRNKVYVTQNSSNLLTVYSIDGKCLDSVGGNGKNHLEFDQSRGLDISTELNRICIAEYGNDRIHCLNIDLSFHSIIDDIDRAKDVKLTSEEIVVLYCRSPCLSLYSYSHQLIRKMIPRGETCQLKLPARFVLDTSSNILLSDYRSHCVCVYSYRGEFLHKFGKEGNQKGDFIQPRGITICPQGRIIVASNNPNHPIQIF